jgi:carbon monoxide dehydrogenase subunit G
MDFKGRYTITADPGVVWSALTDPAVLAKSIPGCQRVEMISPSEYHASAEIKIGPVKARFDGKVRITPHPPEPGYTHAATLTGEGQGGAAGFAKGTSEVRLALENGGTILTYNANASVGGRLAQIGQRLIDGAARAIADEFFAKFAQQVQTGATPPEPEPLPAPERRGLSARVWVAGLILAILVLVAAFSFFP